MFITATIKPEQLVDTIKSLRVDKTYLSQTQKMNDLIEYFNPLISGLISKMIVDLHIRTDADLKDELKRYILSEFSQLVMKEMNIDKYKPTDIGRAITYIEKTMKGRINKPKTEEALLMTPMHMGPKGEYWINRALKVFHQKHKRAPELETTADLIEFAKIYLKKEKEKELTDQQINKVKDIVTKMGRNKIQSLYKQISSGEEGDDLMLIDVLQSDEPLPDVVTEDVIVKEILEAEMKRLLDENEYKQFQMFEFNNLSVKEIAELLKLKPAEVRKNIDQAKKKLLQSPKIRDLRASNIARVVNAVCNNYKIIESRGSYKMARKNPEDLVFEIVAGESAASLLKKISDALISKFKLKKNSYEKTSGAVKNWLASYSDQKITLDDLKNAVKPVLPNEEWFEKQAWQESNELQGKKSGVHIQIQQSESVLDPYKFLIFIAVPRQTSAGEEYKMGIDT